MLAVALLSVAACGSGGDSTPPTHTDKSSGSTTDPSKGKLKKASGKDDIKNVFAKTSSGDKVSLSAAAPGHEIMVQIHDGTTKAWSAPTSVFKDDARFCHSIKFKSSGPILAATVACSITAQDKNGTQSSYVLASTDGKTWKRMDLAGATLKPSISPGGKFVGWTAPTGFLLWSPAGTFTSVKYAQGTIPAAGVMQDDGTLLIVKATAEKHGNCIVSFQSATDKAPLVKAINSTLPLPNHPKCVITSAKMQGADIVANFNQTVTTKVGTKKNVKTTTFAYEFRKYPNGHWLIKA